MKTTTLSLIVLFISTVVFGQNMKTIKLLPPQTDKGSTVMKALAERHSTREFSQKEISLQDLSNILWAANGVNRAKELKHTAPTARNWQDVDVYAIMPEGAYFYNPHDSTLVPVTAGDNRKLAGMQDFVYTAPLNLVYVSDFSRMDSDEQNKLVYSAADAAFVAENVYLCCAAFKIGCVVRASVQKDALSNTLKLRPDQKIILGQTIGYLP